MPKFRVIKPNKNVGKQAFGKGHLPYPLRTSILSDLCKFMQFTFTFAERSNLENTTENLLKIE